MDGLYEWVRNITFYLIFMTVVVNLLPNKKYEKYIKLFAGMVLILLVLKPLTGGLHLDERLTYYFESISFQEEADELSEQLLGMENARLDSIITRYEEAVAVDIKSMAESAGLAAEQVDVRIDGEEGKEGFGKVVGISMIIDLGKEGQGELLGGEDRDGYRGEDKGGAEAGTEGSDGAGTMAGGKAGSGDGNGERGRGIEQVNNVEIVPVEIEREGTEEGRARTGGDRGGTASDTGIQGRGASRQADSDGEAAGRERRQETYTAVNALRRRIADYYDLEEEDIEIQLENG